MSMQAQVIYGFETDQIANRFLNELKHWSVADVDARFYRGNQMVKVSYQIEGGGFDATLSELDDLAASYGGSEVSK